MRFKSILKMFVLTLCLMSLMQCGGGSSNTTNDGVDDGVDVTENSGGNTNTNTNSNNNTNNNNNSGTGNNQVDLSTVDDDGDGYTADVDCNDNNANVNPGSTDRIRANGTFQDRTCDGRFDLNLSALSTAFLGEAANDQMGYDVAVAGDMNNDGCDDILLAAYQYGNLLGRVYVVYGRGDSCAFSGDFPSSLASTDGIEVLEGENDLEQFGFSVSAAGDVNNDGCDDVLIGASTVSNIDTFVGRVYLVHGHGTGCDYAGAIPAMGSGDSSIVKLDGPNAYAFLGQRLARLGDVNGDGCADFMLGAPAYSGSFSNEGLIYLFQGQGSNCTLSSGYSTAVSGSSGTAAHFDSQGYMTIVGGSADAALGDSIGYLGDYDNDGTDEWLYAWTRYDSSKGFVGVYDSSTSSYHFDYGINENDFFGGIVKGVGDVNNDGYADFIAAATGYETNTGYVQLVHGSSDTTPDLPDSYIIATFYGTSQDSFFGNEASPVGDFDNDGCDDFIISAHNENTADGDASGKVYFFKGQGEGCETNSDYPETSEAIVTFTGEYADDIAGYSVSGGGDLNGDGFSDFIVAAPQFDDTDSNKGKVYIVWGHDF